VVKVIFIKNPFNPAAGRVIKFSEVTGRPLAFYVDEFIKEVPDGKAWLQINGRTVPDITQNQSVLDEIVPDNSFIMVMPSIQKGGGKNPLALIASIALSVVAVGVGSVIAGGSFLGAGAAAMGSWGLLSYVGAAAVMFLGGQLVAKLGPKVDSPKYAESDPTYGWDGVQTMEGQGNAIALTYGTVKSAGQSIVKFVTNDRDDQYLNWLVAAGEGPLEITDIKINNNPVENYEGVTVDIRPGTNNQDIINNFNDTIQTKSLGYELDDNAYRTDIADGNAAEGLIVDIECSQGLYYANNDGGLDTAWVDVKAECAMDDDAVPDDQKKWYKITTGTPDVKENPLGAVLNNTGLKVGNYTVSISFDSDKYYTDEDGDRRPNPHYGEYYVYIKGDKNTGSKSGFWGGFFGYRASAYFKPGEKGIIDVGYFRFQKETLQAKGSGYSTTLVVYQNGRISAAQTSAVRRQFRIDNLPQGKYKVRVTVTGRSHSVSNTRAGVKTYWTGLSTIVYDDFIYPNIALLGIKALATSQLSGSTPSLSYIKSRKNVWVWNPLSAAYEEQPADNPAWAAYDFLHGCRQLADINTGAMVFDVRGVPAELMLYDQFKAWAENCDTMNLKINLEVTSAGDCWELVNKDIAPVGRGKIVRYGTKFGCYYDHSSQPVQLFNMGNIKAGSFQLQYLGTQDRANAVELTFNNAAKDYERDTITIYGDDYDTADIVQNPTQIQMNGITSYEQAYREGKYQLKCNNLLQKTISFKADVDSIGCMVGDQILVAHDVPQWALSGRIVSVDDNNTLLVALDPAEIPSGIQWVLQYRSSQTDKIYNLPVQHVKGEWNNVAIIIAGVWNEEDPPQPDDLFVLGKVDAISKPFIVTSITRSQELERTITAIEYAEGVFEENYDIPQPDYSLSEEPEAQNVINLQATQIAYKNKAGQYLCKMFLSWQLPEGAKADYFLVFLSENGGQTYKLTENTQTMELELDTKAFTEYYVKVVTVYKLKQSSGTIVGPVEAGVDVPPPDVKLLDYDIDGYNDMRRFWWDFEYPNPDDIAGFELRYNQGTLINWGTAQKLHTGVVTEQPFETKALRQGIHTVMIKAIDNAGQYSEKVAYASINLGDPLEENVLYKVDIRKDLWSHTLHNGYIDKNGDMISSSNVYFWTTPEDPFWTEPDAPFWTERYGAFEFSYQTEVPASGQFWLKYDITGPATVEYRVVGKNPFWTEPDAPFWKGEANWAFWVDDTVLFKPYTGKVMVKAGDTVQVKVSAPDNVAEATVIKSMMFIVDVPDRQEHFENIMVPEAGIELDIKTPHYYTTAVRVDVQGTEQKVIGRVEFTRNPCVIKLFDINNQPMEAMVDVTWQGFVKEVL
jgi:predicted phage tail protein